MKKKLIALTLSLALTLGLCAPAMAVETLPTVPAGYTIVKVDGNIGLSGYQHFHDGFIPVTEVVDTENNNMKLRYLNTQGKLMRDMPCYGYSFSEGLAPILAGDEIWQLGYMDTTGKVVIPTTLEVHVGAGETKVGSFVGGNALVFHRTGSDEFDVPIGTWSQIDRTGKAVPTTLDPENLENFCLGGGDSHSLASEIVDIGGVPKILEFSEGYALLNLGESWDDYSKYYVVSNLGVTPPTPVSAAPAVSKVLVDGKTVSFDAYVINQNNYFKLRDLAQAVSGTSKQFEVSWRSYDGAIELNAETPYTAVGGELTPGDGTAKTATVNTAPIYLGFDRAPLRAYTIGGNNYFKLRDLCAAFDIFVGWDGKTGTVSIDTTRGYVAE